MRSRRFNQNFNGFILHEQATPRQMGDYLSSIGPFRMKFHKLYEKGVTDGSIRTDEPEETMFNVTMHIMLAVCCRFAQEGCVIISQHGDTIGPAVECENAKTDRPVYHVGYNEDMINVAPTTSLVGTRIDWAPYICGAVGAVLDEKRIEDAVSGNVHGNDIGAGFREGWVKMLELNPVIAPAGSEELIRETIEEIETGKRRVFQGNYVGVDPDDPDDVWDLNTEFPENQNASAPSFHYILRDVVVIE